MKTIAFLIVMLVFTGMNEALCQWATSGNNIYNTNAGNIGIGNSSPAKLLYAGKNMTEPTITIRNFGGTGGATIQMLDDASGADWKFKATNTGGFKIRDNASGLDVFTIEPNSSANAIYIKSTDNMGIGTATPASSALLDLTSTTKGFLPPRMTYSEMMAIPNPTSGLIIFCTDYGTGGAGTLSMFVAGAWYTLSTNCMTPISPAEGTHAPANTQIAWFWNAVAGATGYKWNTTNNYSTAQNMGTSTLKIETGLTGNTSYTRFVWAYNACGNSTATSMTSMTTWICGNSFTKNHLAGNVAPVSKTVTYGTATGIPGEPAKCWITQNLGSDHQATAVDDATEASAGWYWQFNVMQGYKHDGTTLTPSWPTTYSYEYTDWIAANDPCALELGSGWRTPTTTEWTNVKTNGGWTNWNGPWNSALKIHAAGSLSMIDGTLSMRGIAGHYWSITQQDFSNAWSLAFASSVCTINWGIKSPGFSVRCLRN